MLLPAYFYQITDESHPNLSCIRYNGKLISGMINKLTTTPDYSIQESDGISDNHIYYQSFPP